MKSSLSEIPGIAIGMSQKTPAPNKRGPKPDILKIEEDWEDAIDKALRKKRPEEGWPDQNQPKSDEKSHSEGDSDDQS